MEILKKNLIAAVEIDSNSKRFSIKRGISFFWRSNLFLLFISLILLSNWSKWHYDGLDIFEGFLLFSEVIILLFSLIACLKPRVYKD